MSIYFGDKLYSGAPINDDCIPIPPIAAVGQTIKVSAVDDNGKPVEWEAVDFPSGGGSAVTSYINPSSVPLNSGMQIIFYSGEASTVSLKIGGATTSYSFTADGCKWLIWVQTSETGGSLIEPSGKRTYMDVGGIGTEVNITTNAGRLVYITIG